MKKRSIIRNLFTLKMKSTDFSFIIKGSALYGVLAFSFSIIGVFLPDGYIVGNPLEVSAITIEHVLGHVIFGLMIGFFSFRFRYFVLAGLLPLILDSDHLIQFFGLEMIPRMAHSIPFGIIAAVAMMIIYGKKDILLGAIAFSAVFSHISYDILLDGTTSLPFLVPFISEAIQFGGLDWILFQVLAISIVITLSILVRKRLFARELNSRIK